MAKPRKPTTELFLIKTQGGEFKSIKELQEYCDAQYNSIQKILQEKEKMQEEIDHLKNLLTTVLTSDNPNKTITIIKTPAEVICEQQIEKIQETALKRDLTLEEVKKLDLLIKNNRLLKGDSTDILGQSRKLPDKTVPNDKLIELAKIVDKKDE